MVEYSKVNVKLSDAQLKKLKTAVKKKTGTTLRMSLKMLDGNDLTHELLLTKRQKAKLRNTFNNNMSTDLTLSEGQISKIIQSGGFLSIWKIIIKEIGRSINESSNSFSKNVLAPLGTTASASAIDAGIQKKIHSSATTTLIISSKEMKDKIKIVQPLKILIFC